MSQHKIQAEQETVSQLPNLYRSKDWLELKAKKSFLGRDRKVFCRDRLEKDFEESCRDNPEICHDILKVNDERIMSQHYFYVTT